MSGNNREGPGNAPGCPPNENSAQPHPGTPQEETKAPEGPQNVPTNKRLLVATSNILVSVTVPKKYHAGEPVGSIEKVVPMMIILGEADFEGLNANFMGGSLSAGKARHNTLGEAWAEMVRAVDFYLADHNQDILRNAGNKKPSNLVPFHAPRRR